MEQIKVFSNKTSYDIVVKSLENNILSGMMNPLDVKIIIHNLESIIKKLKSNELINDQVDIESDKYPSKTFDYNGFEMQKCSKKTYDYSVCNDSELENLVEQAEEIKAKIKARQDLLKALTKDYDIIEQKTGECLTPPATKTADYYKIKENK